MKQELDCGSLTVSLQPGMHLQCIARDGRPLLHRVVPYLGVTACQ